MTARSGLTPVPSDVEIDEWLRKRILDHKRLCDETLVDLKNTLIQTRGAGEPDVFTYGRLLNYLADPEELQAELIELCASALWSLGQKEGWIPYGT